MSAPYPPAPPAYDEKMAADAPPYLQQPPFPGAYPVQQPPPPTGYPPPPQFPAAAPPYAAGAPTIIVQQPVAFGPAPVNLQCPYCQSQVLTSISHESGSLTWLAAALICILGGFCFCFLIPFCMDSCQDVRHECPHCHRTVGRFSRL